MATVVKVLTLFGTRPEVIKLAPVIRQLESHPEAFQTVNVASGQHTTLLYPFVERFGVTVDHDLQVMESGQNLSGVCARVLTSLDPVLLRERPHLLLVQGDTTTAMAGALAAFHRGIPVGHVEAGLRSGTTRSPFPEEMNRRSIGGLATYHFAATPRNRAALVREGVEKDRIFVTGNPVVDALEEILPQLEMSPRARDLVHATDGLRRVVLTTHRRESFGELMTANLKVLRRFIERHDDTALLFPVHPNPVVAETTRMILREHPRIFLFEPLGYEDFVLLLTRAWLIVSDSGGVQEEAPTLGKPVLIIRENTERPEAVECGVARLVGPCADRLAALLEEAARPGSWVEKLGKIRNPFGRGDAAQRIVRIIAEQFDAPLGLARKPDAALVPVIQNSAQPA